MIINYLSLMIKRLYSWHIKQRRFKLFKSSFLSSSNTKKKLYPFLNRKDYYFASENCYIPQKRAKRHFLGRLFLAFILLVLIGWIAFECYRGWNVFGL